MLFNWSTVPQLLQYRGNSRVGTLSSGIIRHRPSLQCGDCSIRITAVRISLSQAHNATCRDWRLYGDSRSDSCRINSDYRRITISHVVWPAKLHIAYTHYRPVPSIHADIGFRTITLYHASLTQEIFFRQQIFSHHPKNIISLNSKTVN